MRPRVRIAIALILLVTLGFLAGSIGSRQNRRPSFDPRRSTQLTGPYGAKAFAEALSRLGVTVDRFRQRTAQLATLPPSPPGRSVLALLDPPRMLDGMQALDLVEFFETRGDLLLAGWSTSLVMRCFGYQVDHRSDDSTSVYRLIGGVVASVPVSWTGDNVLARLVDSVVTDTSDLKAGVVSECVVQEPVQTDTLLVTSGGRAVALRLSFENDSEVILLADGILFSNARLRESDAGLFTLPLIAGRYQRAMFNEYEQGFGPSGSLLSATLQWSFRSPYGWAFWQLGIVGVLALLAGAIRFGTPRRVIERRRRSPMEHVRALATALAAASGSRVAIELMIQGLRRRLAPAGGAPVRGALPQWLESLNANVRTPRSKAAVSTLMNLTRSAHGPESVLRAANAVEDVWQDLKPVSPNK